MKSTIGIPNPCSEDWSKMTPTEKGAYCGKCQVEVIDFTAKSPEEIRTLLKANVGKLTCGHIAPVQIDLVNSDYHIWYNQPLHFFKSKFLYACFMVFGITLFTGCQNAKNDYVVGKMLEPVDTMLEDVNKDTVVWDADIIDGMMEEIEE